MGSVWLTSSFLEAPDSDGPVSRGSGVSTVSTANSGPTFSSSFRGPEKGVDVQVPDPVVVAPHDTLWKLLRAINPHLFAHDLRNVGPLVAIDPGETTGVARFVPTLRDRGEIHLWQLKTQSVGQSASLLEALFMEMPPRHIRHEDYRIYHWKAEDHTWSQLHTVRLIGALELVYHQNNLQWSEMLAQQAKAFWTDQKLEAAGLKQPHRLRHCEDATRHLLYLMCFDTNQIKL